MNLGGVIHLNKRGVLILIIIFFIFLLYSTHSKLSSSGIKIDLKHLLKTSIRAAVSGGKLVVDSKENIKISSKGLTKEGMKDDVTTADFLSHCAMLKILKDDFSQLNVISEEKVTCETLETIGVENNIELPQNLPMELVDKDDITVWIDPLDATHEYTEKLYEYVTTMVCVAVKGKPIIGVIHKPFSKETSWVWIDKAQSADLINNTIKKNDLPSVIISRSHNGNIKELLDKKLKKYNLVIAAGAGYKSLKVAKGDVDAYLHITAIKKWDICAGNAIINAKGGKITDKFDNPIDYKDSNNVVNENGLVATIKDHEKYLKLLQ